MTKHPLLFCIRAKDTLDSSPSWAEDFVNLKMKFFRAYQQGLFFPGWGPTFFEDMVRWLMAPEPPKSGEGEYWANVRRFRKIYREEMPEQLVAAAAKPSNYSMGYGATHGGALRHMEEQGPLKPGRRVAVKWAGGFSACMGWVTNTGRYVTSEEAYEMAVVKKNREADYQNAERKIYGAVCQKAGTLESHVAAAMLHEPLAAIEKEE